MKTAVKKLFYTFALTTQICACSLLGADNLAEPKIEISKVTIEEFGLIETKLAFMVSVENPNAVSFDLQKLEYNLIVNNEKLTIGIQKFDKKIAASAVTQVKIPMVLKNTQFFSALGQIAQREKTPYKINGTVKLGPLPIPFNEEGTIDTSKWFSGL